MIGDDRRERKKSNGYNDQDHSDVMGLKYVKEYEYVCENMSMSKRRNKH